MPDGGCHAVGGERPTETEEIRGSLSVALAGNPNCGKSTIFNRLTGSRQHTGNYAGVTVEKHVGTRTQDGLRIEIVDLPGIYNLSAYSADELAARDFLVQERPDLVVNVLDASNLERNLYLTVHLMELGVPLVLALNMSDEATAHGQVVDYARLSHLLGGIPVIPTVGSQGEGLDELMAAVVAVGTGALVPRRVPITYGREVDAEIEKLTALLAPRADALSPLAPRWVALKALENDRRIRSEIEAVCERPAEIQAAIDAAARRVRALFREDAEVIIPERRYGFISGACQEAVVSSVELRHTRSDRIDAIVTHPVFGIPIFLGLMYLVFVATFRLGDYPMQGVRWLMQELAQAIGGLWPEGSTSALRSLVIDGGIAGVGGVLAFLPNVLILFFAIAVLEDSGYMARAAFIVDRWMHKVGLHGKSFIPLIIGFGCTVPALMATRVLESRRDRLTTMLILPLMSCGARLPIYVLFTGALWSARWQAPVMWSFYVVGALVGLLLAKLLTATVFRGQMEPFVMELPPFRAPTLRGALLHTWQRGWAYLRKAGTIILVISLGLWALSSYPKPSADRLEGQTPSAQAAIAAESSAAGQVGQWLEPATRPLGFDWRVNTALIGAVAAKEVFVAQMGIVNSLSLQDDRQAEPLATSIARHYTPLQAVAIMLFCLLGLPCAATFAVMRNEAGSWKWAVLQWGGLTAIAYVVTLLVYQGGLLLGLGTGVG